MSEFFCYEDKDNKNIVRDMYRKFAFLRKPNKLYLNYSLFTTAEMIELGIQRNLRAENQTLRIPLTKFDHYKDEKGVLYDTQLGADILVNGKIKSVLALKCLEVAPQQDITRMVELFCKFHDGNYEDLDEDIIQINLNRSKGNNIFYLVKTRKGVAKLNNFISMYPDITHNYSEDSIYISTIKGRYCLVTSPFITVECLKSIMWVDVSYLVKVKIEDLQNPEKVKKLYADILPIVKQYFLSDFTLDNIFYDTRSHKYVIFGIADYIEYNPNKITIDLNSFLNKGLLYYIKGTKHSISFDDYIFWCGNGDVIKKWWEMK